MEHGSRNGILVNQVNLQSSAELLMYSANHTDAIRSRNGQTQSDGGIAFPISSYDKSDAFKCRTLRVNLCKQIG